MSNSGRTRPGRRRRNVLLLFVDEDEKLIEMIVAALRAGIHGDALSLAHALASAYRRACLADTRRTTNGPDDAAKDGAVAMTGQCGTRDAHRAAKCGSTFSRARPQVATSVQPDRSSAPRKAPVSAAGRNGCPFRLPFYDIDGEHSFAGKAQGFPVSKFDFRFVTRCQRHSERQ